jgi:hypothetical protein
MVQGIFPVQTRAHGPLTALQLASDDIQLNICPTKSKWPSMIFWLLFTVAFINALTACGSISAERDTAYYSFRHPLLAILLLQVFCLHLFSHRHVLSVFSKIFLFALCGFAFTMTCMSYTGMTMVENSEIVGAYSLYFTSAL